MGTLSMGIAHEIKNPLNFINNFADISADLARELEEQVVGLNGQRVDDDALSELRELLADISGNMETIRHHGKRADRVVESMGQLAASGSQQPRPTDINKMVDQFAALVQYSRTGAESASPVKVLKEYDEAIGEQLVLPQDLGRALTNVLNNAYDAVEEKASLARGDYAPTIVIQTADLDRTFEIRVRDNGVGIPAKHLPNIYKPFFTTKPAGSGHIGLGLAVSYDVVTLEHHGSISADSGEGRYTQITIRLPKDAPNSTIAPPKAPPSSARVGG